MSEVRARWAATPLRCTLLSPAEFREREDARRAAVGAWPGYADLKGRWPDELRDLSNSFLPAGSMYFCPWYFDPEKAADRATLPQLRASAEADPAAVNRHLSVHYLRDWADKRPPLMIVCPDFRPWCPDQRSSNGTGWTVTGEAPAITCAPSIWTSMGATDAYHGFLQDGVFTAPV